MFFEESFEDADLRSRGWYDNTDMTLTMAESFSGRRALEVRFEDGARTPTFRNALRRLFPPTTSVYVSFWVKYSGDWIGSGRPYHPHDIQLITTADGLYPGPRDTHLTTYVETNYQAGIHPVLSMQDRLNIDTTRIGADLTSITEDRAAGGCNGQTDAHAAGCYQAGPDWANGKVWPADDFVITRDEWHFVEAYFELNTIQDGIGVPDGVAGYWLDGEAVIELDDVLFRTGSHPDMAFRQFVLAPYIGDGSPRSQTMWIDDLTVAVSRD
ncbi:MAG: hypothetical protein KJO65_08290 [Gemmatimonadetes bacterium]|nr:hypothetical protein [Gemmatimonadota bacterium]